MNWQALWNDGVVISIHAVVAILAMAVGAIQLFGPKGTLRHRWLGYLWVGAMAIVALSSFWIHELRWFGPFSLIHGLSLLVLVTLTQSLIAVRKGNVEAHRKSMTQLYFLALVLTGAFTLVPGRTMHDVLFGG
jgi:uncharacterized membrane protein